jgi:protein SCO1/2
MGKPSRHLQWLACSALVFTILAIAAAFLSSELQTIRNVSLPLASPLSDFILTNQNGRTITLTDLRGQVWIGDIIFTSCAGPCPIMTRQMSELQNMLPAKGAVKLVTLTTHPAFDTPEVLKRYGQRFNADFNRWMFLTGSKEQIAHLARDGLKLVAEEKMPEERSSAEDLFIHSTLFVIVDQQGRLRGSFENDDPELKKKVLAAVRRLLREEQK